MLKQDGLNIDRAKIEKLSKQADRRKKDEADQLLEFILKGKTIEDTTFANVPEELKDTLAQFNVEKAFQSCYHTTEQQLKRVDYTLKQDCHELRGKLFNLHALYQNQLEIDQEDLKLLKSYVTPLVDPKVAYHEELKQICLKHQINNPFLGEQLYDPNKYDQSNIEQPFADKITQMCAMQNTFLKYKHDCRKMLDMTQTDKASIEKRKRQEFLKVRARFDLENKGIDAFTLGELKKFYDLEVIPRHVYKRQVGIIKGEIIPEQPTDNG